MICPSRPVVSAHRSPAPDGDASDVRALAPTACVSQYNARFWRTYAANLAVMVAYALLYRYADFTDVLGGSELHLGWIVGVGMVGSLAARLLLGVAIDRQGPRRVWVASTAFFAICCFAHLAIGSCHGPAIYALRIAWCCAAAGFFGASTTFIAAGVPEIKVAEMVGMLGTSGFLGMVLGSLLGDALFLAPTIERWHVDRMFFIAGILSLIGLPLVWQATDGQLPRRRRRRLPVLWILRRYHPGAILAVGVASGIGLALPQTFLRSYAAELNIPRIGLFFAVYAPAAIFTRVLTRRWPERFGLMSMLVLGTSSLVASILLFWVVGSQWQLIFPGLAFGVGHALIFPSVVAAATRTFPQRHRGVGTTLILAAWDLGLLVGAPVAGVVLHNSASWGLPAYPTMFVTMAALMAAISAAALRGFRRHSQGAAYPIAASRQRVARRRLLQPHAIQRPIRAEIDPAVDRSQ